MQAIIAQLREQIGGMRADCGRFATQTPLDELLPQSCFRRGTLVELFGPAAALAVVLARMALRPAGTLAVIDSAKCFYPPAAASLGIDLERLVVVQPAEPDWVTIQALSCPAIDAVVCWPERVSSQMFRRWQLASERGGSLGILVRPLAVRGSPSWADVQLVVTPLAWKRWRLETAGRCLELSIDERGSIHDCLRVVPELADPMSAARAARA